MRPRLAAYSFALLLALSVAYDLWRMPLQVSDSLEEIVFVSRFDGVGEAFAAGLDTSNYFRPLRIAQTKAIATLSGGAYHTGFKAFHAALVLAAFLLFVRALDVRTNADLVAAGFALLVFTGIHTFLGLVKEAYPVNHFLEVVALSLLALNLARSRGGVLVDLAAAAAVAAACLTLESGVLVWVVLAAARASGLRGVSARGLAAATVLVAVYAAVRLFVVRSDVSDMMTRDTGFLFGFISPADARARWGHAGWLYLYNVVASVLSVLFAEPRRGVWVATRSIIEGEIPIRFWVYLVSQLGATALILTAAREFRQLKLIPIFATVLIANAAISFAYTKDEIVSVAGAFYALAAYAAARHVIARSGQLRRPAAAALGAALVCVSCAWGVRVFGVHHVLQSHAFKNRSDWAELPQDWKSRGIWPSNEETADLIARLRSEALRTPVVNPRFVPRWSEQVFDVE